MYFNLLLKIVNNNLEVSKYDSYKQTWVLGILGPTNE
jgi:hypothetical protein